MANDSQRATLADLWVPVPPDKVKTKPGGPQRPPVDYVEWPVAWARVLECDPHARWEVLNTIAAPPVVIVHGRLTITDPETGTLLSLDAVGDAPLRENGAPTAESQALKRACGKFGVGISLYKAELNYEDTPLAKQAQAGMSVQEEPPAPLPAADSVAPAVSEAVREVRETATRRESAPARRNGPSSDLLTGDELREIADELHIPDDSPDGTDRRNRIAGRLRAIYGDAKPMVSTRLADLLQASITPAALESILGLRQAAMNPLAMTILSRLCAVDAQWDSEEFQEWTRDLWTDFRSVRRSA